jgi:guanylate kinase
LGRGQDDLDTVEQRFKGARDEIAQYHTFDYLIVNDDFQLALQQLSAIVFEDPTPFEIKAQAARHADLLAALTT